MTSKKLRFTALLLVLAMVITAICGCGKKSGTSTDTKAAGENETQSGESSEYADMTAIEFTRLMGNGINLGNTLESGDRTKLGTKSAINLYETNWGQPVTTKEMVQGMKDAGFDSIRIPIAWTCAINYEDGDYTIRQEFMDRIKEVVGYALDADMKVIINDHWDNQWWGMFGDKDTSVRENAMTLYKEMWKGIAEGFKDYDERVVFEGANEELGDRLNDNWKNTAGKQTGVLTQDECYETVNTINQTFVDVIRAAGGYNETRFLLIPGYDTNVAKTCDDRYKMPTDTAKDKLIVSVHYYDPSNYCIDGSVSDWGVKADYTNMNTTLKSLTKFTDAGYGVIIGEWGVLKSEGGEDMCNYYENFLNNCDAYGYAPMLWDCSTVYDRSTCKMKYDDVAKIITNHSFDKQKDADVEEFKAAALKKTQKAESDAQDVVIEDGTAWIMFNSSDYQVSYAVGDDHPSGGTAGIKAEEAVVTGEGTYTVSLDFTETAGKYATSFIFAAIGIYNGEKLFPGYIIDIQELVINGEKVDIKDKWYTTTDDKKCTRLNLYNGWVSSIPDAARTSDGDPASANPTGVILPEDYTQIKTISVTFTYGPAK